MARIANRVIVVCGEGVERERVRYLLATRLDGALVVGSEDYQRVAGQRGEMIVRAVVSVPALDGQLCIPAEFADVPLVVYDPLAVSRCDGRGWGRLIGAAATPENLLAYCRMALQRRRKRGPKLKEVAA